MKNNYNNKLKYSIVFVLCLLIIGTLTGCGLNKKPVNNNPADEDDILVQKEFDRIIALIQDIDQVNNSIKLINLDTEDKVELKITGAVDLQNKYGEALTLAQLKKGDIIRTKYDIHTMIPESVQITAEIWEHKKVRELNFDQENKIVQRGSDRYMFTDDLIVTYNGMPVAIEDINKVDELTIRGYKNKLWVVIVDNGHGTVELKNYSYFIGGTIEIGTNIIETIGENMKIDVPVGVYKLKIEKDGLIEEKEIMIEKDKTLSLDFAYMEDKVPKVGSVAFQINVEDVMLYVNGQRHNQKDLLELGYGEYSVKAEKEGYGKYEGKITVSDTYLQHTINLEKDENYINIQGPAGVEVYYDGSFVGIAPIAIKKTTGQHAIILRKDGFETKTYYIDVIDDGKDSEFSFPALLPIEN